MPGTGPVSVPTHPKLIWLAVTPTSVAPPVEALAVLAPALAAAVVVVAAAAAPLPPAARVVAGPCGTVVLGPLAGAPPAAGAAVVSVESVPPCSPPPVPEPPESPDAAASAFSSWAAWPPFTRVPHAAVTARSAAIATTLRTMNPPNVARVFPSVGHCGSHHFAKFAPKATFDARTSNDISLHETQPGHKPSPAAAIPYRYFRLNGATHAPIARGLQGD